MNINVRQPWSILIVIYGWLGWATLVMSQTNPEDYPPPPVGVQWGWQGEVLFDYNSAKLIEQYKPLLLRMVETLKQSPSVNLLITGRADNTGSLEHNRRLSQNRIEAVKKFLTKRKIASSQIYTQNLAEQKPVSIDACAQDRPYNRRVDLAFYPASSPPPLTKVTHGDTQPLPGECEQIKSDLDPMKQ